MGVDLRRNFLLVCMLAAATLPSGGASADMAGNAGAGAELYNECRACHGHDGEGSKSNGAPKIAGQSRSYMVRQLRNFRDGTRGSNPRDMRGRQMRAVALRLPDDQALLDVAEYVTTLEPRPVRPTIQGDAEHGAQVFAACSGCHGVGGAGNEALGTPRLVGQLDWYILDQLEKFRSGLRGGGDEDWFGRQMVAASAMLGDDADLRDLVAYISTLVPDSAVAARDQAAEEDAPQ